MLHTSSSSFADLLHDTTFRVQFPIPEPLCKRSLLLRFWFPLSFLFFISANSAMKCYKNTQFILIIESTGTFLVFYTQTRTHTRTRILPPDTTTNRTLGPSVRKSSGAAPKSLKATIFTPKRDFLLFLQLEPLFFAQFPPLFLTPLLTAALYVLLLLARARSFKRCHTRDDV